MFIIKKFSKMDNASEVNMLYKSGKAKFDAQQFQQAIQDFDKALVLDSQHATLYQLRGVAKLRLNQYSSAVQDFDKAIKLASNNPIVYQLRGEAKRRLQQYETAIQDFDKALALQPNSATVYRGRGAAKLDLGQYVEAIKDFDEALLYKPDCAITYGKRGEAKRQLKHNRAAVDDYEKALALDPQNKRAQQALHELKKHSQIALSKALDNVAIADPNKPVSPVVNLSASYLIAYSALTFCMDNNNQPIELGAGGFGKVYKGKWQYVDVAIKKLKIQIMTENALKEFKQETKIMAKMTHPNVIRLYGACIEPNQYAMVMEYMPKGSLYHVLHSANPPPWSIRWKISLDIGKGILHLHKKDILHRDLKSLNVLLDSNYQARVSDFGLSLTKTETQSAYSNQKPNQMVGTIPWMAPELFEYAEYTKHCDIYSFGMILWEIATCKNPYLNMSPFLIIAQAKNNKRESIPKNTPPSYAKLITQCWAQRAERRPNIEQVVKELYEKQDEAAAQRLVV